jgi:DNA-binding FrmR family transcriptional regulator
MLYDKDNVLLRLRRVEGQVRGVQKMVEEDRYCMDILTNSIGLQILEGHAKSCMTEAIQSGEGETKIREIVEVLRSFVK